MENSNLCHWPWRTCALGGTFSMACSNIYPSKMILLLVVETSFQKCLPTLNAVAGMWGKHSFLLSMSHPTVRQPSDVNVHSYTSVRVPMHNWFQFGWGLKTTAVQLFEEILELWVKNTHKCSKVRKSVVGFFSALNYLFSQNLIIFLALFEDYRFIG